MFARFRFVIGFFFIVSLGQLAVANVFTIALTGGNAPGTTGVYEFIDAGTLNESGEVAYTASLEVGAGGVTSSDNEGVWQFSSGVNSLVARTGSGNVPGDASADYLSFYSASMDDTGGIVLRADLTNVPSDQASGIWRYSSGGGGSVLVRSGSGNVPGLHPSVNYFAFITLPSVAANGDLTFIANLEIDAIHVFSSTDRGVWKYSGSSGTLVAREGHIGVPGFGPGTEYTSFAPTEINNNDQVAFFALAEDIQVYRAVWNYTGSSGQLIAQVDAGNVPGVANANFKDIDDPTMNDSGQMVFKADIDKPNSDSFGIWSFTGATGSLLLHDTLGVVPGDTAANIQSLDSPMINNSGRVLVGGELVVGIGGATSQNSRGLWFLDGGGSEIARSGSGGVPELASANFATFDTYALNDAGQIALLATLESGIGGVDSTNDQGLWILNPFGESTLIAREGDLLAGNTIKSLDFISDHKSIDGFNHAGQLLFQATFANDDTGLFLYRPFAADFNSDGGVDGNDLASWQSAYGQTAEADADLDGNSGNLDYLYWAREFSGTNTVLNLLIAVPEPTSSVLILTGLWFLGSSRRRIRP